MTCAMPLLNMEIVGAALVANGMSFHALIARTKNERRANSVRTRGTSSWLPLVALVARTDTSERLTTRERSSSAAHPSHPKPIPNHHAPRRHVPKPERDQILSCQLCRPHPDPSPSVKMLGVTIDHSLSWEEHISTVTKKCNSIPFCLYKIRHFLTPEALKLLVQSHVFPYILYCLSVWGGAAACHLNRIQKVINFGARIVSGARKRDSVSGTLRALGWHDVSALINQRDNVAVFRAMNDPRAPAAVRSLFTQRAALSQRTTRASSAGALQPPAFRLSLSRRAFSYRAALSWNRLPPSVTGSRTRRQFLTALSEHLT